MANLQEILKYQAADRKLYAIERELAASDERKEYMKVKKFMEAAPEKLDSLENKALALKTEAAELTKKYEEAEGTLKEFENVDELVDGGADISFYKKKVQAIMDKLKKLKADLNALTANITATSAEYQKLKKQVISMQKQYKEAQEKYNAVKAAKEPERKEIEKELAEIAKNIDEEFLVKYKTKRKERVFPVVGEVVGGMCICGMEVALATRNRLSAGETVECDNCHRIIYAK